MIEDNGENKRDYLREGNFFKVTNPEEVELAYQLQNFESSDINLIRQFVFHYGPDLFKWIEILLAYGRPTPPEVSDILEIMQQVWVKAFRQVDQFHGQTSVINWLFELSYPIVKRKKRTIHKHVDAPELLGVFNTIGDSEESIDYQQALGALSETEYLTILLRYLFDSITHDIALILNISSSQAFRRFSRGRSRFFDRSVKSHNERKIQEYLEGLLDGDNNTVVELEMHINECQQCQSAVIEYKNLDKKLAAYFKNQLILASPNGQALEILVQAIYTDLNTHSQTRKIKFEVRKSAWFIGFALFFVMLAVVFIKLTPVEKEFPQPPSTENPELPPISEILPPHEPADFNQNPSIVPRYVEPDFSSNGNWGVFSAINADPITGLLLLPTIELYDRSSNDITVIHESIGSLNAYWSGWDLAPTISADGRWIAYAGTIETSAEGSIPCVTLQKNSCVDIYLYDRELDITVQVTHGWNGGAANGVSLSPAISANGDWIAFWSMATNMTKGDEVSCETDSRSAVCMYVYLFNQTTGRMKRIPIGTTVGGTAATLGPINITSDGRYISYTTSVIGETSYPATYDGVTYNILGNEITRTEHYRSYDYFDITTEAIVYDRLTGQAEILNRAENGIFGNGASSSPILSENGRYAAFVSGSSNLVEGDTNDSTDIFVRDRETGVIEMVSINTAGEIGNNDSGFTQWRKGYNSLDISDDGRYVVFESTATNLGQRLNTDCYYYQTTNCILLYIHDRQTKQTELINALPYGDFLRYPNISEDGRWISYMQSKYKCNTQQDFCSNVMLYDQSNRWVRNLTNYGTTIPSLPWSLTGRIALPWEAWESKTISISRKADLVAVGGMDSKIRIWKVDRASGAITDQQPIQILDTGKNDIFSTITFSPNEQWVLAGTMKGIVYVWRLPGGEMLYTIDMKQGFVKDMVFTNDCTELIILTSEKTSIWQIQDGQMVNETRFTNGLVADLSPLGNLLAYDHGNGETWVKQLPDGEIIGRLSNGQGSVKDMVFSEDGSMLATRFEDGMIIIWRIQETNPGVYKTEYQTSFKSATADGALIFSPNNIYLTTSGTYGDVVTWRVFNGEMFIVTSSFQDKRIDSMAFDPSGNVLAVLVENEFSLWKTDQEITFRYFSQASEKVYNEGIPHPLATGNDIPEIIESSQLAIDKYKNLSEAINGISFPLLVPTRLPEFINFSGASLYTEFSICLRFDFSQQHKDYSSLFICESYIGNSDPPVMKVGPDAEVIPIDIETISGPKQAEYVRGDWYSAKYGTKDSPKTSGVPSGPWIWDTNSSSQRLRWVQYGILVSVYYQVNDPFTVDQDGNIIRITRDSYTSYINQTDLMQIAVGMRKYKEVDSIFFLEGGG